MMQPESKFNRAAALLARVSQQLQQWDADYPKDEARRLAEQLLVSLSDDDFSVFTDLLEMIKTEPGRRLFGDADFSGVDAAIKQCSRRRAN